VIPPTILFVDHDADPNLFQLSFSNPAFSPIFNRWRRLRKSGITVDFQRILRFPSGPFHFKDYMLALSAYEEGEVISQNAQIFSQIYRRQFDGAVMVVKSISLSIPADLYKLRTEIENLLNLRHPMITPLIGYALPMDSTGQRALRTMRLYAAEGSLADVLSNPPGWWTPTVKAKAIVGIALGLRFAHGLGLLHGAVKASNILFDADRRIQIADFSPIRLETGEVEPFSGEGWAPTADVCAFASLLFEIAVGRPSTPPIGAVGAVPAFVSRMIEDGRLSKSRGCLSFVEIVARLKASCFKIVAGVDSDEVSEFVKCIDSSEQAGERQ
jgi:serine/threonine protein kinase